MFSYIYFQKFHSCSQRGLFIFSDNRLASSIIYYYRDPGGFSHCAETTLFCRLKMTISDWLKNCHLSMEAGHLNGFGAHSSVKEHATLDGGFFFFFFFFHLSLQSF